MSRPPVLVAARLLGSETPGGILVLVRGDEVSLAAAGVRRLAPPACVTLDTLFRLSAPSYTLTSFAALRAVEDAGLAVDLDAPITDHLTTLDVDASAVTLHHLLTLGGGLGGGGDACTGSLESFADAPPMPLSVRAPPGTLFTFNTVEPALAGRLLEVAAGGSFDTIMEERLFAPLGMDRTVVAPPPSGELDVAAGYERLRAGEVPRLIEPSSLDCRPEAPFTGTWSSARDMAIFLSALVHGGEGLVDPALFARFRNAGAPSFWVEDRRGYGLIDLLVRRTGGEVRVALAEGDSHGYSATLVLADSLPEPLALLVVTNFQDETVPFVPFEIVRRALVDLADLRIEEGLSLPLPAADWSRYVGVYRETTGPLVLEVLGPAAGALAARVDGADTTLTPVGLDRFRADTMLVRGEIRFVVEGSQAEWATDGQRFVLRRVP
jgi:CubicO group peptidase (beta-lactamase class C family)